MGRHRAIGTIFQEGANRRDLVQSMKDIAAARNVRHGQLLAGTEGGAEIGDGGPGIEAALLQLEQADGPRVGIAMVLEAEQKAVGRSDVGTYQHGLAILEDLIETGDADVSQILASVIGACLVDSSTHDVVHRAERQVHAKKIAAKLGDAAIGTVADERQTKGGLPHAVCGDRMVYL